MRDTRSDLVYENKKSQELFKTRYILLLNWMFVINIFINWVGAFPGAPNDPANPVHIVTAKRQKKNQNKFYSFDTHLIRCGMLLKTKMYFISQP